MNQKTYDRFTEVVAHSLDIYDQQQDGKYLPLDHKRWEGRYSGIPQDELPPRTVVFNVFRSFVDQTVALLLIATDDDEWEKAKSPVPGLSHHMLNKKIE